MVCRPRPLTEETKYEMRYSELFENDAPDQWYFHVTTEHRLKSIMARGIEPGHKRRWSGQLSGKKLGDRGYIYLIKDFTNAVRWAAKMEYDFRKGGQFNSSKVVILAIHNPPGKIERDPHPQSVLSYGGSFLQTAGVIPPDCIKQVIPLSQPMIRELVQNDHVEMPTRSTAAATGASQSVNSDSGEAYPARQAAI